MIAAFAVLAGTVAPVVSGRLPVDLIALVVLATFLALGLGHCA